MTSSVNGHYIEEIVVSNLQKARNLLIVISARLQFAAEPMAD